MTKSKVRTVVAVAAVVALAASPGRGQAGGGGSSARTYSARSYSGRSYSTFRGAVPRAYVARPYYARPYYTFRPRVSLGFGLWMGYPVDYYGPYSYAYPYDPYAYSVAPSYGYPSQPYPSQPYPSQPYPSQPYDSQDPSSAYPPPNYQQQQGPSVGVQRGQQSAPGGISFEITPDNAQIFVDGRLMGTAGEFGPTSQPLDVSVGRHHLEIRAPGYRTMTFDADVRAGQVIPYQGTLQRN